MELKEPSFLLAWQKFRQLRLHFHLRFRIQMLVWKRVRRNSGNARWHFRSQLVRALSN